MIINSLYLRSIIKIVTIGLCFFLNTGFVHINPNGAHLPSTLDAPEVTFFWDGTTPNLKGKDSFRDGIYNNLSDKEVMFEILKEAADTWNSVQGSYLKLRIEEAGADSVKIDNSDKMNVITAAKTGSYSSAAFAQPVFSDDNNIIVDCDITVDPNSGELKFLLYALVHEMGHCIGLGHAHDNYKSIMGYSRTPNDAKLSADDKAGIISLYPDPSYGDPKVVEAVNLQCGVVAGREKSNSNTTTLLMLIAPILCIFSLRLGKNTIRRFLEDEHKRNS